MKAVLLTRHAETNDVLEVRDDLPEPVPGAGEVRVRIAAAALNRLDLFVRNGIPGVPIALPSVPGGDGCGTVDAVGDGVTNAKEGDRVVIQPGLACGKCEFCRKGERPLCVDYRLLGEHLSGTFAEATVVPAENVFPWPDAIPKEKAAAFPLAALTAWRMLVTRAALKKGESLLIHGIGGGVSTFALQIGKLLGAAPILVTSSDPRKLEKAKELGADVTIDYRGVDVGKKAREATGKRGVDVVVDSVGEATWRSSLVAAAKGGRIVTCGATTGPNPEEEIRFIFWKQLSILGSTMGNDVEFRAVVAAVAERKIDPVVDAVFPLEDVRAAYARMESGEGLGKIVVTVS